MHGQILSFSREGVDFQKQFEIFVGLFLGGPNWFSELSQINIKAPHFDKLFKNTGQKGRF